MNNDNININNNINNNDDDEDNKDDIFRGCVRMSPFFNSDVFCHISFVAGGRSEFRVFEKSFITSCGFLILI